MDKVKNNQASILGFLHKPIPAELEHGFVRATPPPSPPPSGASSSSSAPVPEPETDEQMEAYAAWCQAEVAGRPDQHKLLRDYLLLHTK